MDLLPDSAALPIVPYIRESDFAVRPAYYFPFRKLLDYLFIYIRKGELHVVADGTSHRFEEGQFCLLQPGTVHDLRADGANETPFAHMDIFYEPQREKSFPTRPGQLDLASFAHLMQPRLNDFDGIAIPVLLQPQKPHLYRHLLLEMVESWQDRDPLSKLKAQAAATRLVHLVLQDHAHPAASKPGRPQLDWIPSYFSFHLADPLDIEELARRAHLSTSRFRAVFRERFGLPPHRYLMELRLEHARELLAGSDHTASQIADYCGFSSLSHFHHAFRARMGASPGAYREQSRKAGPAE
ncbi:AraC family transcriptional regulator [Paenibacillus sp. B01]|uniref:AraC family transcriptional regulator n=1 Tax=Paenibacillus sp. B01 TaxID=2660554 RepID=UPI00129BCED5|nr:AraC family transcriptional regulator [Paenibacillus sp. B01]QGG54938.1 helix-turn-helix domain-containing protein [Paenibacillus sp. B01]